MAKQYGLILPDKNKPKFGSIVQKPSIFQNDSDSDDAGSKPTGITTRVRKQDKIDQSRALEEDPTVYQYDEIYDEMDQKRKESKLARKDLDKKPKYISKLLAAAERRKRENERRIERQVQKERENEGDLYKDKESFVTSAYKKKLEEMRELDEQEKYEDYLESIGDVKKQGNLDGFYRHFYDQKVNYEHEDVKVKQEDITPTRESFGESSKRNAKERKYRKRTSSEHSEEEDEKQEETIDKKEHLPSNLDADSDFSIDSSDSEDEKIPEVKEEPKDEEKNENEVKEVPVPKEDVKSEDVNGIENEVKKEQEEEIKPKKPKIDIWKKRTVGEKFDEAVKRYFERKAQREMILSS